MPHLDETSVNALLIFFIYLNGFVCLHGVRTSLIYNSINITVQFPPLLLCAQGLFIHSFPRTHRLRLHLASASSVLLPW